MGRRLLRQLGARRAIGATVFVVACIPAATMWTSAAAACKKMEIMNCYKAKQINNMLKDAAKSTSKRGKVMFGNNFKFTNKVRFRAKNNEFLGDMDVLIPLKTVYQDAKTPRAAFLWQGGMSKWNYRRTIARNDLRLGGIYRFADVNDEYWYGGMLGVFGFLQQDVANQHSRLLFGADYTGKHGRASMSYYMPLSGWRQTADYQTRALGGGNINVRLNIARRLLLNLTASKWQKSSSSGGYTKSLKMSAKYQLRHWLAVEGNWRYRGNGKSKGKAQVNISIPLDPPKTRRSRSRRANYSKKLYAPMNKIKKIKVQRRS